MYTIIDIFKREVTTCFSYPRSANIVTTSGGRGEYCYFECSYIIVLTKKMSVFVHHMIEYFRTSNPAT